MVILITGNSISQQEGYLVNDLFDRGLSLCHIRNYGLSDQHICEFILSINSLYRKRLVLHSHHHLLGKMDIDRLHFSEDSRKRTSPHHLAELKRKGITLSASVHSAEAYDELEDVFSYAFLSPVFNSISKKNYPASSFNWDALVKKENAKLIALGGINSVTCSSPDLSRFDGIALMGAIWKSESPLAEFDSIIKKWNIIVPL